MCGIAGYVGPRNAKTVVLEGLKRLEYRGYDSAGIAFLDQHDLLHIARVKGRLHNLTDRFRNDLDSAPAAIGHTRWATHGVPCEKNAHPHRSADGEIAVVHNGIVENYQELRSQLQGNGYVFASDTDTEVIAHLIHYNWKSRKTSDLVDAVRATLRKLKGSSAIVVLSTLRPDTLIAARLGNAGGVVIGYGENEMYVASDIPAILKHTCRVAFLENGELAVVTPSGAAYSDSSGTPIIKHPVKIEWDAAAAEKGSFAHYMLKEIFEQEQSLTDTLRGRIDISRNQVRLDMLNMTDSVARRLSGVTIVACGSSYYAGLLGKQLIERLTGLHVEVDFGSEFRYRHPVLDENRLVLAITQSGETTDTLAALEEARERKAFTASIVSVVGSQAARVSDGVIYMQVGPEIGVATTKAFTASLVDLYLLAVFLGTARGTLDTNRRAELIRNIATLPRLVGKTLESMQHSGVIEAVASKYTDRANFLYLGRGLHYPIALEGALKLKEISYIHAEGYPAGEMKHGPIALIDERMPTVVIAPKDSLHEKMVSQIEQVKARNGAVIALATQDDTETAHKVDDVVWLLNAPEMLTPILAAIPLQLLAYEIAVRRGTDIDHPRNLAKSVTVE
ncbi:MAG: glutamine--fructose-6-phosphate transaminase (isomerizing) [Candidatus Poribacteria bacterium]|nr:glutamine--fructose-6-phosphate transaminase (isomerizing) [Candidatus Poribacteria bacterium]